MNLYDMPENIRVLLELITSREDWPQPESLLHPMLPVPELRVDMLPQVIADSVFDEAERMSCPPDYIAVAVVVALGAVIGSTVLVRPKQYDYWFVVCNLWGAVIGYPGTKKSAAINAGVGNVYRLNSAAQDAHRMEVCTADMQKQATESQIKSLEREIRQYSAKTKNDSTAAYDKAEAGQMKLLILENKLQDLKAKKFDVPPVKRYFTNDATIESIGAIASQNPRGLMVLQDELMSLLTSFEKNGRESDRQAYLTGWNGDSPLHIDRITRGNIYIENFCLSVLGGIQPDVFLSYTAVAAEGGG